MSQEPRGTYSVITIWNELHMAAQKYRMKPRKINVSHASKLGNARTGTRLKCGGRSVGIHLVHLALVTLLPAGGTCLQNTIVARSSGQDINPESALSKPKTPLSQSSSDRSRTVFPKSRLSTGNWQWAGGSSAGDSSCRRKPWQRVLANRERQCRHASN